MQYNFKEVEERIMGFWAAKSIYRKAKDKNHGKKAFYFLDGPPYTSGKVHLGTAWNKALKDMFLRYKRMSGFDVWDRAGYDMHGLPTEHAVEKKLGIKSKDDIYKMGVASFVSACKKLCVENMEIMNRDFQRLGVWMDFDNAYQSITDDFIEGVWWLIKEAHTQGRLYEGLRTMTWCPSCASALAKHELEYRNVSDESIFLKFKIRGKENEYLVVWTTTPWTIPFNLAVMANPELDYVKCELEGSKGKEYWIVAKELAGIFIQGVVGQSLKVVDEFKGEKIDGLEYEHPFRGEINYDRIKLGSKRAHTVILSSEYVDTSAGTGLVHCAPGCGPEDYEVGHSYGIPPFNNITETGEFPKDMGKFSGWVAKKDDKKFIEELKRIGALVATSMVEHEYAHCQRCHKPVVFRATKQWFFRIEDLKEIMIKENSGIKWVPDAAFNAFNSWLENLRDNSITKQRFWGTPLPVWKCQKCGKYDVMGSIAELKKVSGKAPKDAHKPWIDEIAYPCACGGEKKRIPDIIDVWVDAGTVSWNCLGFPQKKALMEKMFPAEFILEGKDQIRGWYNLLMVASVIAFKKTSFKSVYMHGFVNDSQGRKMSKSLGIYILPEEVINEFGADTFRYYMIGGANPGIDINYNKNDVRSKFRNIQVFWNLHNFVLDLAKAVGKNPALLKPKKMGVEENYIISKLNSAIEKTTAMFEGLRLNEVPLAIEDLLMSLSRVYIQMVRDKAVIGSAEEKEAVLYSAYTTLVEALKMFSAAAPFVSEQIFLNFREAFGLKEESISLCSWPKADKNLIDSSLEEKVELASQVVTAILAAREKAGLSVRWPAKSATVISKKDDDKKAIEEMSGIIKSQANVKEISVLKEMPGVKEKIKADFKTLGPDFGERTPSIIATLSRESAKAILGKIEKDGHFEVIVNGSRLRINRSHIIIERDVPPHLSESECYGRVVYLDRSRTEELDAEGYAREVMRRIQALRKDAGLERADRIALLIKGDEELVSMLGKWEPQIQEKCGASKIKITTENPAKKHRHSSKEKAKGKEFEIFFDEA